MSMDKTPELPLNARPVFDLNIESGCEWPMPSVRPWKPVEPRTLWTWLDNLLEVLGL